MSALTTAPTTVSTMYQGVRTGHNKVMSVQNGMLNANGSVNINALMAQMVSRDIWEYYYTLKIAPGSTFATDYSLFQAINGNVDPYAITASQRLSRVETNMPSTASNGFPPPKDLIMDTLGFYFRPGGCGLSGSGPGTFTNVADMVTFCQYSYFEFKILDKTFIEGCLEFHPGGLGFTGVSTTSAQGVYALGMVNPHAVNRMNAYAKYLAPQMQWSLTIFFPSGSGPAGVSASTLATGAGGAGLWLVSYVKGLTDRAVQ